MVISDSADRQSAQRGFVERHELYSGEQMEAARRALALVEQHSLRTIRIAWADQHGVTRSKSVSPRGFASALSNGIDFPGSLLLMDTTNHVFTPPFAFGAGLGIPEFTGYGDFVLVPDPTTFQELPWTGRTGWVLSDVYYPGGQPVPLSTRGLMRDQLTEVSALGYDYLVGLEVEFYITRRESTHLGVDETGSAAGPAPPPPVSAVIRGYQVLSETRFAEIDGFLQVLWDHLASLGLPLRSMENEGGPGQVEITFDPLPGLAAADAMVLFRSAIKQICFQHGYHATFMSRPAFPTFFASGWHLHQCLLDSAGNNALVGAGRQVLSDLGLSLVAGLLDHAIPMTVFATPTINGYKRFKAYSMAPDRVNWAVENRGALIRVQGEPSDPSTHIENRMGELSANPYLYMAANIAAGLDGIRKGVPPPAPIDTDPYAADSPLLPRALWQALDALDQDAFFRGVFGDTLIEYILAMKQSEIDRFLSEVTDWEMREYFEFF